MHKPLEMLSDLVAPFDAILARVWLVVPGEEGGKGQDPWLHLEASAGLTQRTDGPFRRLPLSGQPVGNVVIEGEKFVARERLDQLGLAEPEWIRRHGALSFAAFPLPGAPVVRGAFAIFSRRVLSDDDVRGLEAIARLLAVTLDTRPGPLRDVERGAIERALTATRGRVSGPNGAARILGLKPTTLHSRMRKLGVRRVYTPAHDP